MTNSYAYIAVEGIHDAQFLVNLLSFDSFTSVTKINDVDEFWRRLIPTSYPYNGDLQARVPVPFFVTNGEVSVSIQYARGGVTSIPNTVYDTLDSLNAEARKPTALGVILDADSKEPPRERWKNLALQLNDLLASFDVHFSVQPGVAADAERGRTGGYVIPDNSTPGTLEDILLTCAEIEYGEIGAAAQQYVATVESSYTRETDLRELRKPAGRQKAVVSSIASVLKPGRAIQVSIQDNRWLSSRTLAEPKVALLRQFLRDLIQY